MRGVSFDGMGHCLTEDVLKEVAAERARQFAKHGGNYDTALGMGPETRWLLPYSSDDAQTVEAKLRFDYEDYEAEAPVTWLHLIREEVAELFSERDLARARAEALQVAALCVSLVEKIDAGYVQPVVVLDD